jgi:Putative adhesin
MQKTFETYGPLRLDIRVPSGEVLIEPGREGVTELELEGHDDASRQAIEEARVELVDNGHRLVIDVNPRSSSFLGFVFGRNGVTCRVRCPEGASVDVRTKSADVQGRGRFESVEVKTASGDVVFDDVEQGVTAKSASGDIRFERVGQGFSAQSASGDIHVGSIGEGGAIQTVSGDVFVGSAGGSLSLNSVSGDVRVDAVHQGNINLGAVSGDIVVGVRRGSRLWVDAQSISGETESELELAGAPVSDEGPLVELRAKTVSGDIRVVRAPAPIHEEVHQ